MYVRVSSIIAHTHTRPHIEISYTYSLIRILTHTYKHTRRERQKEQLRAALLQQIKSERLVEHYRSTEDNRAEVRMRVYVCVDV
jgi:hypothetical protein